MVNNYTAAKKRRRTDAYSPGGIPRRPDRAAIVYADRLHGLFPGVPIVLGGLEASLRRFAHYDYWSDRVRRSILADAPADLLVFGMGERQVVEIARRLAGGEGIRDLTDIRGTAYRVTPRDFRGMDPGDSVILPPYAEVAKDRAAYARAFALHAREQDPVRGKRVAQDHGKTVIIQNPPSVPLSTEELDRIYQLPYTRRAHPSYREKVPALEPVRFSLVSHRGCFGGCSFCAIGHHQGRIIQSRSAESLVREAKRLVKMDGFAGVIQDLGGPTANMYGFTCPRWSSYGSCEDRTCGPDCRSLVSGEKAHLALLRRIRAVPGVKKVFVSSGIRHDLIDLEDLEYLTELCRYHVSGHLKVAPEHISPRVISLMNKPGRRAFDAFRERFSDVNRRLGKEQSPPPVLHVRPPRLHHRGYDHPGRVPQGRVPLYRAGSGLHPHPYDRRNLHVLHRDRSVDWQGGSCAEGEGEGDPAGYPPLPGSGKGRSRQGRPHTGREEGPDGERVELPRPCERSHPYQGKEKIFTITLTKYASDLLAHSDGSW